MASMIRSHTKGSNTLSEKGYAAFLLFMYFVVVSQLRKAEVPVLDGVFDVYPLSVTRDWLEFVIAYMNLNYSQMQLSTVIAIGFHIASYWIGCIPSFLFRYIRSMEKHKIQSKHESMNRLKVCSYDVILHQAIHEGILYSINILTVYLSLISFSWSSFPKWYQCLATMILCMVTEDTWHFLFHAVCHSSSSVYKYIHKKHHEFPAPFSAQATYCSFTELVLLGTGFMIPLVLFMDNFYMVLLWMLVRQFESLESHSGYDTKWLIYNIPLHLLPGFAGARFHDYHHSHLKGNFASSFRMWDCLFDTDTYFKEHEYQRLLRSSRKTV